MTIDASSLRRPFFGKEVGVVLGVLVAGSLLISGGFVPTYLAVLFASSVRNASLAWLGNGVLFYAVAFGFLYLEAVVLTAIYLVLRAIYRTLQRRTREEASV